MADSNRKDTYLASAITLTAAGVVFLLDKFVNLAAHGHGWLVDKSNLLLFAALIFLIIKSEKTVGVLLLVIWSIMNIRLIVSLLGQLSGYLLPLSLLIAGGLLFYLYRR